MTVVAHSPADVNGVPGRPFRMELHLSRVETLLTLSGVLTAAACEALTAVLARLDALTLTVVRLDLGEVTYLDVAGLAPIVDAAHRRAAARSAPLRWHPLSHPVRQLLTELGMDTTITVDVPGWAAATGR